MPFKSKKIYYNNYDNEKIFNSISLACRELNISYQTLIRHINKGKHNGNEIKFITDKEIFKLKNNKYKIDTESLEKEILKEIDNIMNKNIDDNKYNILYNYFNTIK